MRFPIHGVYADGEGNIVVSGTAVIYEYNSAAPTAPTTVATFYAAKTGGAAVTSVTTDSNGVYEAWIDNADYTSVSIFTLITSKSTHNDVPFHFTIPGLGVITTKGDIIQGDASGDAVRKAIGADGTIPYVSTDLVDYDKPWSIVWKKGGDLDSSVGAGTLTLTDDGNYFDVTGTTTLTSIVANDVGKVFRLHFDGALILTHHATNLVIPSGSNITTIAGDDAVFMAYDTGDVRLINYYSSQPTIDNFTKMTHTHKSVSQGGILAFSSRGYLAGYGTSIGTDTAHDIDIAVGECRDSTNGVDMVLASALTKQIDATWASGTAAGGLSSSLTAPANDTWYHVHAIIVAGAVDIGFDTSVTAANLGTDHSATSFRRIGSVRTNGSANIIAYVQTGDGFIWDLAVGDWDEANPGTSAVTRTLKVPTGVVVYPLLSVYLEDDSAAGDVAVLITSLDQTDSAPDGTDFFTMYLNNTAGGMSDTVVVSHVTTNISAQIRSRISLSQADITLQGITHGWIDRRGRDD